MLRRLYRQSLSGRTTGSLASRIREKRWAVVRATLGLKGDESVLDVGGTDASWWFTDWAGLVVRLNLDRTAPGTTIVGDGCALPFDDHAFDVAFSNSVIEHIPRWENQKRFAQEFQRAGQRFFLQTPNRYFPLEPHYLVPFFQFFPNWLQRWFHRHFTLGSVGRGTDADFCWIRLMTRRELRQLFPNSRIIGERLGPFVKSWYVVGG